MRAKVEWKLTAEIDIPDDTNAYDYWDVLSVIPSPYDFVHQDDMVPPDPSVSLVRLVLDDMEIEYEYNDRDNAKWDP